MRVLSVASEIYPLVKTGGLADVVGALPAALKAQSIEVHTLVPGYPAIIGSVKASKTLKTYDTLFGGKAELIQTQIKGLDLLVLDAPHLYNRPGNPYLGPDGKDWSDNGQRFAALSFVAADIARVPVGGLKFGVLHAHDWQAALSAVYVRYLGGPKTILTIHNIAFQGNFGADLFSSLGLPPEAFAIDALEYYGRVSFLKGGIASASAITTVSPTYAEEICTPEFGMGLEGVIQSRKSVLHGIVNGIDIEVWNPETDKLLPKPYSGKDLTQRVASKRAVEKRFGLTEGDGIIHGLVSRLTMQKGIDILAAELDWLVQSGARLALIGAGDSALEAAVASAAQRHTGRIGAVIGYDEELAHLLQGGADTILVPSRFEPCGLTQLYGLRYGCIPIVSRTGGLADTVIDANDSALSAGVATGFHLPHVSQSGLQSTLARAQKIHAQPAKWKSLQSFAMQQDVSWSRSAKTYASLYSSVAA
jgi:starch synthase